MTIEVPLLGAVSASEVAGRLLRGDTTAIGVVVAEADVERDTSTLRVCVQPAKKA